MLHAEVDVMVVAQTNVEYAFPVEIWWPREEEKGCIDRKCSGILEVTKEEKPIEDSGINIKL